ncbi:MAG: hypothetical protein GY701_07105, partial [Sulfitobacter sp.]|nr:hypothetical protein [Sulfitobacter sp.]
IRSQFQQYIGSFVPFWYAEELFLKRTARALIESPEMFRRGQLMMDGVRTIGVVREGDFGNEVFVTPNVFNLGTTMTDSVSWAIARFTGSAPILPHADGLMGQTQYALPGYNDDFGAMAAGPMISYGIQNISSRFPELSVAFDHLAEADDRVVLGDRSPLEYFFPSWGINLIKNRWGGTDGGTRLGSDVANALKVGAVLGDLPHPDSSNDVEWERAADDLANRARLTGMADQVFRWSIPGGVSLYDEEEEELKELAPDFIELLKLGIPYPEAMTMWIEKHGTKATPMLLFSSESPSGAVISQTQATLDYVIRNEDLISQFPMGMAFVLPYHDPLDDSVDHEFDRQARQMLLRTGLREHVELEDFEIELRIQEAQRIYYQQRDIYAEEVFNYKTLRDVQTSRAGQQAYADMISEAERKQNDFETMHFQRYPLLAAQLEGGQGGGQRREAVMTQMDLIIHHPDTRDLPETLAIAPLLERWRRIELEMKALPNTNDDDRDFREDLRIKFRLFGENYVRDHPEAAVFWENVLKQELTEMDEDLEFVVGRRGSIGAGT